MIRSSLRQYLVDSDIVGTRAFPVVLPQSADLPAITYARTTGAYDHNLKGSSGVAIPTFELDCWAPTYEQADQIAEAVRQKMQGFSGTMGSVTVTSVILDDESDHFEPAQDASDRAVFRITLRYRVQHRVSVPAL